MKRIVLLCTLLFLLTACSGSPSEKASAPSEDAADEKAVLLTDIPQNSAEDDIAVSASEELETLLEDIYAAVPGTADSTLKAVYAAGELLDYTMNRYCHYNDPHFDGPHEPEEEDFQDFVNQWVVENVPAEDTIPLVYAWDAVMTQADALLAEDPDTLALLEEAGYIRKWDFYEERYLNWWGFSPLYTQIFDRMTSMPFQQEAKEPSDFDSVSADRFEGLWLNSEDQTLLIFHDGRCRVVYPGLSLWGESANAYHIRDRSDLGYCPALEIDFRGEGPMNENGDFYAPIAYYVSGMDDTHFWCNSQWERFDRIDIVA